MVRCVHHIVDELLHRRLLNTFEVVTDAHIKDERFTGIRRLEHRFEKVQGKPGFEVFIPGFKQGKFGRPFGVKALVFGIDTGLFQLQTVKNLDGFSSMKRPPVSQEVTIFCASCVCGPAAGPTGVAQVSPKTLTVLLLRVSKTVAREYQRLSVVVGIHQICASKVPQTEWDA